MTRPSSQVDAVFIEAVEFSDAAARSEYLDRACGADHALRVRVERLLAAASRVGAFLEEPACLNGQGLADETEPDDEMTPDLVGQKIGSYKLLQKLGEGGMGVVYMAAQDQPVRRRVAVKVIRAGMDSSQVVARFEQERQALALMDHPHIARVLDAGATTDGRPYFAMELVQGNPITRYCDQQHLSIHERIGLFIPVCQAIQHAHQKGIIHRDLKPSNVIVALYDGQPIPKVIDFGVAKATGQRLIERTMFTELGQIVGTMEYMAPEQAEMNNLDVDTRADIYSLGVLLYELLTGSPPFTSAQLRAAGLGEMLRILQQVEPTRPSTKITQAADLAQVASNRQLEPHRLVRALSGELDWITMKCLEKDRARRYPTANGLARDLERFLSGEPVQACPPTAAYRLRKFVGKHRAWLTVAAAFSALLVAATAISAWQAIMASRARADANRQRDQALNINQFMYDVLTSVEPEQRGADVRLVEVLEDASTLASLRFARYPEQEADVRMMLGQIYTRLSLLRQATAEYEKAVGALSRAVDPLDRRLLYAQCQHARALLNQGLSRPAASILEKLTPTIRSAVGPNDVLAFDAERLLAGAHMGIGNYEAAETELRQLHQRAQAIDASDEIRLLILDTFIRALEVKLDQATADLPNVRVEAMELAQEMVERSERTLGADALQTLRAQVVLARCFMRDRDWATASAICEDVLKRSASRLGPSHDYRLQAMDVLARVKHRQGDSPAAADLLVQRLEESRENTIPVLRVASIGYALPILDRGGRWADGEALAREFSAELTRLGGGHDDMLFDADLAVARFVALQGRNDEATSLFTSLENRLEETSVAPSSRARYHLFCGSHLRAQGEFAAAEKELEMTAAELTDIRQGTCQQNPDDVIVEWIALYDAWGKPEQAEAYRQMLDDVGN